MLATIAGGMTGTPDGAVRRPAWARRRLRARSSRCTTAAKGDSWASPSAVRRRLVSFLVASALLKLDRVRGRGRPGRGHRRHGGTKGKKSSVASGADRRRRRAHDGPIQTIVFACDAGMGSSAMGASVLRRKIQEAGYGDVTVDQQGDLEPGRRPRPGRHPPGPHRPGARSAAGSAVHVSVDNFMASPRYDEIVELLHRDQRRRGRRGGHRPGGRGRAVGTVLPTSRSCSAAGRAPGTTRSPRPASCWSRSARSSRRTSTRCTSGSSRCPPTWATGWRSRTAPTTRSRRSGGRRSRSSATTTASTGTARRPGSWSASRARARSTSPCSARSRRSSWTRSGWPSSRPRRRRPTSSDPGRRGRRGLTPGPPSGRGPAPAPGAGPRCGRTQATSRSRAAVSAAPKTTTRNGARSSSRPAATAEPGEPGVEHQALPAGEDLHGDQRGEQRDRDQVGDPLDQRVARAPGAAPRARPASAGSSPAPAEQRPRPRSSPGPAGPRRAAAASSATAAGGEHRHAGGGERHHAERDRGGGHGDHPVAPVCSRGQSSARKAAAHRGVEAVGARVARTPLPASAPRAWRGSRARRPPARW